MKELFIVIRAGGGGTRLWPLSREANPKQLLPLLNQKTMLVETLHRVKGVVEKQNIFISTNNSLLSQTKKTLPKNFPTKNLIIEPERKDTAAAVALESAKIYKIDPDAIVASIGSDHIIRKVEEFRRILKISARFIRKNSDKILLIGIKATRPETGFGYIEIGDRLDTIDQEPIYIVRRFTEKPNLKTAKSYIKKGNYLWNGNLFVWRAKTVLALYKKLLPDMYKLIETLLPKLNTKDEAQAIRAVFSKMQRLSVDNAILEKSHKIACTIKGEFGWNDIGDLSTLKDELKGGRSNLIKGNFLGEDIDNCLIINQEDKKLITGIGLKDLILINTPDAILVCPKNRAQEVKKIVEKLKSSKLKKYI